MGGSETGSSETGGSETGGSETGGSGTKGSGTGGSGTGANLKPVNIGLVFDPNFYASDERLRTFNSGPKPVNDTPAEGTGYACIEVSSSSISLFKSYP